MKGTDCNRVANALLLIGAINWGLIGLFGFNFVAFALGPFARLAYIAVGWAAFYRIFANGNRST